MGKVITGIVRFSYANVFEPRSIEDGGKLKYSVSLIIPKSDKKTLAKIESGIKEALEEGKSGKFGGKIPNTFKNPLRDGDAEREDDENYEGSMFMNANSDTKPGVVDMDRNPILEKDEFYSGCYGYASVNLYPFNFNGTKGIACGLNNLMKAKDGERLSGGGASAEEDFDGVGGDDLMG